MSVRWGILSTARINEKFLAGCGGSDELEVVAVASRDGGRARAYADRHGIARAHEGYDALLADPEVDAVYNPLPNGLHREWTERALRAGKHVLCEKPMGRSAGEVTRAFDLAEQRGLILSEAFMYRHHPQTVRLAELVAEGAIGPLRLIQASFGFAIDDAHDVRLSAALGGGALMDVGCYCVSAARLLAGEPERVTGQQVLGGDGVDVAFVGTMAFAGGAMAHFDAGFNLPARSGLEVTGADGSLLVADPWHCREPGLVLRRPGHSESIAVPRADSYRLEAEDVAAAIRGERPPRLGRADAVGQAATIEALYRSASGEGTGVARDG